MIWMMTREKFLAKTAPDANGCLIWLGCRKPSGYGQVWSDGRMRQAHRVAYELFKGQIPDGYDIDHQCNNAGCVNHDHLVPTTPEANRRRRFESKTHCKRGHELTDENTWTYTTRLGHQQRNCKQCVQERKAALR